MDDTLPIDLGAFSAPGAGQYFHHETVCLKGVRILFKQGVAHFSCFDPLAGFEVHTRQQNLQVCAVRVFGKHRANFCDGLGVLVAPGVHLGKRAARQADLERFHTIAASIQPFEFSLQGRIGGLLLVGALHVPDSSIQVIFLVADEAHGQVRDEIIGR